jgi:hypothetical protein
VSTASSIVCRRATRDRALRVSRRPRISFGIIVLNGEPFTRYCLRALYPFAHEIIVVEGGHEDTWAVATPDGHSIDGTLEKLQRFARDEDPDGKLRIVTRDGFWPKCDELGHHRTAQSRAYAELATGDYLWQVDIDEFYRPEDMAAILELLGGEDAPTHVSFDPLTFFGDLDYLIDGWLWDRWGDAIPRIFKWGPGYRYVTHEPATVEDESGRDVAALAPLSSKMLAAQGIYLYHYCHLFPQQVRQKALIYRHEKTHCARMVEWAQLGYFELKRPYRVHQTYRFASWLRRYSGPHPPEVVHMMEDARSGRITAELRDTEDIERLLDRWWYPLGIEALEALEPADRAYRYTRSRAKNARRKLRRGLAATFGGGA